MLSFLTRLTRWTVQMQHSCYKNLQGLCGCMYFIGLICLMGVESQSQHSLGVWFLGIEELNCSELFVVYVLLALCLFFIAAVLTGSLTFPHSWMSGQWCHTSCSQRPGQQSGDWEADQTEQSHKKSSTLLHFLQSLNWQTNTAKPSPRRHTEMQRMFFFFF